MSKRTNKYLRRISEVFNHGASQLIPRIFTLINSWLIIHYHSSELWGSYVEVLLLVNVALLFLSFGNFQYLLKKFSEKPSDIIELWSESFWSRLPLVIPIYVLLIFLNLSIAIKILVVIWVLTALISQSFQILIVFNKKFSVSLIAEIGGGILLTSLIFWFKDSVTVIHIVGFFIASIFLKMSFYIFSFRKLVSQAFIRVRVLYLKRSVSFFSVNLVGTLRSQADIYLIALLSNSTSLGKYHVLIMILGVVESCASFMLNPFLKLFYRMQQKTLGLLRRAVLWISVPFSLLAVLGSYLILSLFSNLIFPSWYYFAILLFSYPILMKIIVVNELFKQNAVWKIVLIALIFLLAQVFFGFIFIPTSGIEAAIVLKCGGGLLHLLTLYFYFELHQSRDIIG